jgi:hypothetical protein
MRYENFKEGGRTLHKGETEEEQVGIEYFTELVHDAADQVWLHCPTHAYPIHLLGAIIRE